MDIVVHRVRSLAQLPFYCDPVYLFVASWLLMLSALEIQVSELTYPGRSMGFVLFLVSLLSMLAGVAAVRLANYGEKTDADSLAYTMDGKLLRKINWILCISLFPIVLYNWISAGPPPIFSFIGISTLTYAEYGRFKQVLQPIGMALFLNASLEESSARRWLWRCTGMGTLLAYVARGPILVVAVQALVLYSIRTSISKRKIYVRATVAMALALIAMDIVGENRTAQSAFFEYLEIKQEFRTWPVAVLWPISYMSIPISNMCWIVQGAHFNKPEASFLYPVLPSFWVPANPHAATLSDRHLIDGVNTYLANYFLDFSWPGIIVCNFLIGLLSGFLTDRERISRNFMTSPVLLSAFTFIFFWDFFVFLPTILELLLQSQIQKLCITPVSIRRRAA